MSTVDKARTYKINLTEIEKTLYDKFESDITLIWNNVLSALEENYVDHNVDQQLKILSESTKEMKKEVETKLSELSEQQTLYERYKRDHKLLQHGLKENFETFVIAKKCYKRHLKMYYSTEKRPDDLQAIFVQFFTESKKDNENYSVRLLRYNSGQYELLSTQPKLKKLNEFQTKLSQTNDVPGALSYIREEFVAIKEGK